MDSYPPEPWDLTGKGYVSLWLVPATKVTGLPPGVRPVSVAGRAVVATGFVDYQPGGLLEYRELLVAVLVRQGFRLGLTITQIWVDSQASRDGARAMWGIPKELAEFDFTHSPAFSGTARLGPDSLAKAAARSKRLGLRLPFPLRASVLQALNGELARTPLTTSGRVRLAQAVWGFDGPLAWLQPHRPFFSIAVSDFAMRFGPCR